MGHEAVIPIEEYHYGSKALSKTGIAMLLHCPSRYQKFYLDDSSDQVKDSPATRRGSAVHCLVLEPDTFAERYLVSKAKNRLTKAYKEEQGATTKIVLTSVEYDQITRMRDSLFAHTGARVFLNLQGKAEQSFFWDQRGVELKCRPDFLTDDSAICIDLKTTRDASPEGFKREADSYKYWLSAAITQLGVEAVRKKLPEAYVYLCVENSDEKRPEVGIYYATEEEVSIGKSYLDMAIDKYLACKEARLWPSYTTKCEPLGLPWYRLRELERITGKEGTYV